MLHFIRNTIDQKYLESAYQTCTDAQKNLERLTIETFKTFKIAKSMMNQGQPLLPSGEGMLAFLIQQDSKAR